MFLNSPELRLASENGPTRVLPLVGPPLFIEGSTTVYETRI